MIQLKKIILFSFSILGGTGQASKIKQILLGNLKIWEDLFQKYFIYLFLERGEGKEKERKRNINVWLPLTYPLLKTWPATQVCALDWKLNLWPFGLQACAQSTELHQPGQKPEETFKSLFYHLIPTLIQFLFVSEMVHR